MMTKLRPWTLHLRRALASPGNLIAGAGAVLASAVTWNPLPLILFGLGEPVWLYTATASGRYTQRLRDDHKATAALDGARALAWRESSPGEKPTGAFDGRGFVVTQAMTSLTGSAGEDFASILRALGYRMDKRPPLPPKPAPEVVVETVATEAPPVEASAEVAAETPAEEVAAEVPVVSEPVSSVVHSIMPRMPP